MFQTEKAGAWPELIWAAKAEPWNPIIAGGHAGGGDREHV